MNQGARQENDTIIFIRLELLKASLTTVDLGSETTAASVLDH